jgi:two-component system, LytTR family, response regulator
VSIRTLLVDDEELARRGLRVRLERAGDVAVIGECANGGEAIAAIGRLAPDLVFLDVQMPEVSGFDVIEAIGPERAPHIIFVTAYDQYAVRAFDVHALDYLLKPIDDERLGQALRRVREALSAARDEAFSARFAGAMVSVNQAVALGALRPGSDRLAIPSGDRVVVVRIAEVDWVEASGNYVSLHIGKKAWLLRETIAAMDQRLGAHGFARIHRSTLVNTERVAELRALANGEFAVLLRDGTELKLSRSYRHALDALAGSGL